MNKELGLAEQKMTEHILKIMEDEDEHDTPSLIWTDFIFFSANRSLLITGAGFIAHGTYRGRPFIA